jgi:DNA-directed RNA polymerase subunit M/transcription elongation factor TFIIS
LKNIKGGKMGWKHECYDRVTYKIEEQDEFITNPFEVCEGVLECKCGSKRVFSYQRQQRGSDEPMTTFAQCMKCSKRWTYSG